MHVNALTVSQLFQMQISADIHPVYSANGWDNVGHYYWPLKDSIDILLKLLMYQFDYNICSVVSFLQLVYQVLDKTSGKCNTILITGPASSGKNMFVDPVCDFMLNPGKIENFEKGGSFNFQTGHNRRVNKWDECVIDEAKVDNVLNLMQGKTFMVNIKFRPQAALLRTPLFVMSNLPPFPNEPRFNQRHVHYRWRVAPILKKYMEKQPYPLAAGAILMWANKRPECDHTYVETKIYQILEAYDKMGVPVE